MTTTLKKNRWVIGMAVLALLAGLYFMTGNEAVSADPLAPPPPTQVRVIEVKPSSVQLWKEFSGRLQAVDFVEVRPQVSGTITDVRFADGQMVQQGDVLLVIDPKPYQAAVDQARAALSTAKNRAALAQKDFARAEELIKTDAIAKQLFDSRQSGLRVARAEVTAAEAALKQAEINLDRAYIKAPISGRVSRAEITVGNLVEAGSSAPLLTTIVSDAGIYADFTVDEQTYLSYVRTGARDQAAENKVPVKISLANDSQEYDGEIKAFDNRIDPSTGTIRARAFFANKDGALLPGMFVRVALGSTSTAEEIVLAESVIGTDQDRKFVLVVDAQNMAQYREVKLGAATNGQRVIASGLAVGDRVITNGMMRVRPGMPVVVEAESAATAAPEATPVVAASESKMEQ